MYAVFQLMILKSDNLCFFSLSTELSINFGLILSYVRPSVISFDINMEIFKFMHETETSFFIKTKRV